MCHFEAEKKRWNVWDSYFPERNFRRWKKNPENDIFVKRRSQTKQRDEEKV